MRKNKRQRRKVIKEMLNQRQTNKQVVNVRVVTNAQPKQRRARKPLMAEIAPALSRNRLLAPTPSVNMLSYPNGNNDLVGLLSILSRQPTRTSVAPPPTKPDGFTVGVKRDAITNTDNGLGGFMMTRTPPPSSPVLHSPPSTPIRPPKKSDTQTQDTPFTKAMNAMVSDAERVRSLLWANAQYMPHDSKVKKLLNKIQKADSQRMRDNLRAEILAYQKDRVNNAKDYNNMLKLLTETRQNIMKAGDILMFPENTTPRDFEGVLEDKTVPQTLLNRFLSTVTPIKPPKPPRPPRPPISENDELPAEMGGADVRRLTFGEPLDNLEDSPDHINF